MGCDSKTDLPLTSHTRIRLLTCGGLYLSTHMSVALNSMILLVDVVFLCVHMFYSGELTRPPIL